MSPSPDNQTHPDTSKPNILIVKMWALGDILMATPLLSALKRRYPGCSITWLADKGYSDILRGNPYLDEVIAFDSASWRRQYRYAQIGPYLNTSLKLRKMLLAGKYDIVINLTAEKWWSVWFGVAPIRIGLFPRAHAGLVGRLYTHAIERTREPWLHNTQHYLLPAKALGIPEPYDERMSIGVSDAHRETVDRFLSAQAEFDADLPLIVMHPGTSQASKCWPVERFAELANRLDGYNVVLTGSPGERALCESIAREAGRSVIVAAGPLTDIGQTAALVERAAAVVTGDTSILHIASALDKPLVGIYGSTRPRDNAPLFGRSELLYEDSVPCAPCYKAKCPLTGESHMRCMREITIERVLGALERLGLNAGRQAGYRMAGTVG